MPVDLNAYPKLAIHKLMSFPGASLQVRVPNGPDVMFCKLKAFKLKEDITLFTGKDMKEEVINIKARQILDFSASYDVFDCSNKARIGSLRRHGWKSTLLRDSWSIMDEHEHEIGKISEDSALMALARRLVLGSLLPQNYDVSMNGDTVAKVARMPFINVLNLDFDSDMTRRLDRRLGVAAGVLLCVIEGMQA